MKRIQEFLSDEKGTETVEWAIMIGLIAFTAIATLIAIATYVDARFTTLNNAAQGR
jgi:Flp pilus assembly pilin Flp